jgi:hypothetical protein
MDALEKLLELDDRHNELLEQLARLDAKISETLNHWSPGTTQQAAPEKIIPFPTSRVKAA